MDMPAPLVPLGVIATVASAWLPLNWTAVTFTSIACTFRPALVR